MRDRRFVAVHRGGPLDAATHRLLAVWAADCAERLLRLCGEMGRDERSRCAVRTARAWARRAASVGDCQRAAVAAHAAATAHMADHSLGVVIYGAKAVEAAGRSVEAELEWQLARLPHRLRRLVESALERRRALCRNTAPT